MSPRKQKSLRVDAVRLIQSEAHPLFLFSLTGEDLFEVAEISRVSRDDTETLIGYQRSEVKGHVQDILKYLEGEEVIFPNSIILAVSSKVTFIPASKGEAGRHAVSTGTLVIPLPEKNKQKPAWIVDGQQRALAVSKSSRRRLPIPINAFVADDVCLQRDQFLRVNNSRPLGRDLLAELLPEVPTQLPSKLAAQKAPSVLCDILNRDPNSPFHGLIRRASTPKDKKQRAVVATLSVINMIRDSISSPRGCLFPYYNVATREADVEGIRAVLYTYWGAVKNTFPDAWGKPPTQSRLMHGAGIRSMGRLMDRVMRSLDPQADKAVERAERELQLIAPICQWTGGRWEGLGNLGWNEVQNTPTHINSLSSLLVSFYVQVKA
jgi:DGQHR domain-containing protein